MDLWVLKLSINNCNSTGRIATSLYFNELYHKKLPFVSIENLILGKKYERRLVVISKCIPHKNLYTSCANPRRRPLVALLKCMFFSVWYIFKGESRIYKKASLVVLLKCMSHRILYPGWESESKKYSIWIPCDYVKYMSKLIKWASQRLCF